MFMKYLAVLSLENVKKMFPPEIPAAKWDDI